MSFILQMDFNVQENFSMGLCEPVAHCAIMRTYLQSMPSRYFFFFFFCPKTPFLHYYLAGLGTRCDLGPVGKRFRINPCFDQIGNDQPPRDWGSYRENFIKNMYI